MGEYAEFKGERIKIGTRESMYYLRFDQREKVRALPGNVDPVKDAGEIRFRFPWPDEDKEEPGSFGGAFDRGIPVDGFMAPEVEHYSVQFSAPAGYLVSLPCPESNQVPAGPTIHRNRFRGAVQLTAQRYLPGVGLVPVLRCGGCGSMWREPERARIEELAVAIRAEADRMQKDDARRGFWQAIAERVLEGGPAAEPEEVAK